MPTVRGTRGNFARSKKLAKYTQTLHLGVVTMINIELFADKKWVATTSYTDWDWVMMLLNLPNIFCRRIERSETGSDMQIHTLCVLSSAKWNVLFMELNCLITREVLSRNWQLLKRGKLEKTPSWNQLRTTMNPQNPELRRKYLTDPLLREWPRICSVMIKFELKINLLINLIIDVLFQKATN